MAFKPAYLSGGRGRGQNTKQRAGYSVGGVHIDRRRDSHQSKPTKTTVTSEKQKQQRAGAVQSVISSEFEDSPIDTPGVEEQTDSHEEQVMEKVLKSYKKGSSNGEQW